MSNNDAPLAAPDIYIPDYSIEMPKEFAHFLLCALISRILVTKQKKLENQIAKKQSSPMMEIKEDSVLNTGELNTKKKTKTRRKNDVMVMIDGNYDENELSDDDESNE